MVAIFFLRDPFLSANINEDFEFTLIYKVKLEPSLASRLFFKLSLRAFVSTQFFLIFSECLV